MLNVAKRALSTMNYFFLRVAAGKEVGIMVNEELESFITNLSTEHDALPDDVRKDFQTELIEGNYFTGKSRDEAKAMIDDAVLKIMFNPEPEVTDFYLSLFPSFPLPEYVVDTTADEKD